MTVATTIKLPDAEELMRRLTRVDNDAHFVKYVYPYVCTTLGDQPTSGENVMTTLSFSVIESASIHRLVDRLDEMMQGLRKFAEELLVDDLEDLRADALAFLERLYTRS